MTLTVKERAILLSEAGMSNKAIAGVLGVDLIDVRALMTEAEPGISLGGGVALPTTPSVPVDPLVDNNVFTYPAGENVNEWADLEHRTAPTDASAYLFQLTATLLSYDSQYATVALYGGGEQAFNDWWIDGASPPPVAEAFLQAQGDDPLKKVLQRHTLNLYVAAGAEVGLYRRDQSNLSNGSSATWQDVCWIPIRD